MAGKTFTGTAGEEVPNDGENFTVPLITQVPVVYDPPEPPYVLTPTLLKTTVGGQHAPYNIGGGIVYYFNQPSPYSLIMRSDHIKQLLYRFGPQGKDCKELIVVDPKDWPDEFTSGEDKKGNPIIIKLHFKEKIAELKAFREKEHARLFPDFATKLLGKK